MRLTPALTALLAAALPVLAAAPVPARAGEVQRAEAQRLREDMRSLAQRNAWEGVERAFEQLERLGDAGEELTFDDLLLGAQAARALGDMTACRDRLVRAVDLKPDQQAVTWLEEIDATYGAVRLKVERGGKAELKPDAMPFVPDQRKAIEAARKALAEHGRYEGLLPGGTYTLGAVPFQVTPGEGVVELSVRPQQVGRVEEGAPGGFRFGYVGPRVELGVALTQGGDPSDAAAPPAFGGPGVRLGVGVEVGLPMGFGAAVTVGYHGLRARVDRSDADRIEEAGGIFPGDLLRMGYLAPGVTWRWLDLWVGAGPVLGMGTAQVVNPDETDAEHLVWTTSGPMLTAGLQGSVAYALFRLGPQLRAGIGGQGGLLVDGERLYTWGQVALTLGPASGGR